MIGQSRKEKMLNKSNHLVLRDPQKVFSMQFSKQKLLYFKSGSSAWCAVAFSPQ